MALLSTKTTALLVAVGFTLLALPADAQSIWHLITPDEEVRDDAAPHVPAPADRSGPPGIDLVRPDISRPVQNPVTIELRFTPGPGGAIDMATFNATYGWLGINVTRRLLEHSVTTASG